MIREIAIYVEGGGDGENRSLFRRGVSGFFRPVRALGRPQHIGFQVVACGGRNEAYEAFVNALRGRPHRHCILLVDSEEPVADMHAPWAHLHDRRLDRWPRPHGATDEQCHLMVICMESWFLADPDSLARHFGSRFDASKLPTADHAESIGKDAINSALEKALQNTPAKKYRKIHDGAKLLAAINPVTVRNRCKGCNRLFDELEKLLAAAS